ncbi:CD225/dispanin family protein [bacterium]|nr:CD225/dispanin family protein [Verrucomicrobiota bacterium]MDC0268240.1 CD225/dispanin family protein [bacterium]MDG1890166.1 CD225/dispanin family protein [Verrucomicrobiota bacterium]
MYCPGCGDKSNDVELNCSSCGEALPIQPKNYLPQSIFITACCCLPFGIVAIIYAAQVNGKAMAGDLVGAIESSRKAKWWCYWGSGLGLIIQILFVIAKASALENS